MEKIFQNYSALKQRIVQYLDSKGIRKESFYAATAINATNFRGKQASSELGGDKIVKILSVYRDLSPAWLLLGEGSMIREIVDVTPNLIQEPVREIYKPPPIGCELCKEKERTIEAMKMANEALQTAVDALKRNSRYSNGTTTSKQTG